jgi:nucleoside-diphosphate-sugar epimerase
MTGTMPGRLLVTGGAGFLGRHLAERLGRDEQRVRILDRAEPPAWARTGAVEYLRGDVRDPGAVRAALDGVRAVVHAAFASPREPLDVIRAVNVEGTRTVGEAARALGVPRFVLVSSTVVLWPRRVHPLSRRAPLSRLDDYRASRVEAEARVEALAGAGLSVAIARPKTFLGPGRVSAFALLFEAVRRGQPVPVLGPGANRYQLLDVRDLADGIARLAGCRAGGVFALGAEEFRTVREDLQALVDHAGTGAPLRFVSARAARLALRLIELAGLVPLAEWHYRSARGEDSVLDIGRARTELSWRPARSNARLLVEAYDWYAGMVAAAGAAPATHRVPLTHRLLERLGLLLPGASR